MAFIFSRAVCNSPRPLWLCRRCVSASSKFSCSAIHGSSVIAPARTRFAPSPTGYLHLGSLRTALFNYLLAKKTGGQFLLRIEDTDKKRTVEGAEEGIFDTLRWAGLQWDEGPLAGGEFGPYRQSERTELHRKHVDILLREGHAYRCYCTPQRLEALALTRKHTGQSTDYDRRCLNSPPTTSITEPHVVRLKAPVQYPPYHDLVYGTVTSGARSHDHSIGAFEDPILLKSDGMPTYHLANVVDDHFMNITHVVRATEWMPSTPKHVHLYNCFGWVPPKFVHVGLLQDIRGRKLSKRTGDVFVSEFREKGYLPEALNNFVALMGWSHAGESDVLDMQRLVERFSIDGLTTGNTKVEFGKLDFLQKQYARNRVMEGPGGEEILDTVEPQVRKKFGENLEDGTPITRGYVQSILQINIQNYLTPSEFTEISSYFFQVPSLDGKPAVKSIRQIKVLLETTPVPASARSILADTMSQLEQAEWTKEGLEFAVDGRDDKTASNAWRTRMKVIRLGLSGGANGPAIVATMLALGKDRCVERLRRVIAKLDDEGGAVGSKKPEVDSA